ncbi:phage tail protein [Sediminicoccus rosea]|uniref:Phage tail protein n=1 Tax=Sediminicoccus rosea TaxID=1225128 RepID=A0ABZ0PE09_9PROT|nr:phage tail protein [Sediminicoccus rosea]WPB83652.1 phage tail protein [Sediminicoccus rosea]
MPVAIPFIAAAAGAAASAVIGGGVLGAVAAAGAALVVSAVGAAVFRPKSPSAARSANVTPGTDTGPGSGFDPRTPGAGRTQSFRQPITEHQIVFGRCRTSGPVVFLHSATDDEGRADGFLHVVVVLAAHRVRAIGEVFLNGTASTDAKFAGLLRIDRALGDPGQAANANLVADTGGQWTAAHRGQGRAYLAVRLKLRPEAFPSGAPSLSAIVEGADTILDPRTGATGWSDNPALCLAWYLTSPFGWRAAWADIDLPALMAAANICDEIMGRRDGTAERRYTVNGAVTLGEGKIAITRKLVAAMAGALVVSGGRFYIHAGAPALPAATLTSDDLRGDVTIVGSRPRRDLFNGVRAVYVEPAAAWQPTDAPPLLASNYVTEDGGEAIYRDMEFPLTTSAATVQRLMKIELERNRRQREVAMQANLSALRLRPWDGVTVALERLTPFPARVTGWALASDGGVNLQLAEEDPAVWAWNPATDERATGQNPSVVLPNPGVIAAPAAILVETPLGTTFTAIAVSWSAVGSAYLAGYEIEFRPASVAVWQGYAGGFGATAVAIPTAEPTAFRVRAQARSGAVSGWREALVPAAASGLAATGIAGGVRLSGGFPADAVRLQVFEASSASLTAATKLASEPTALPWDRTGLTTVQTRWYWLRSVSAEGNVSAFAGPVTATAL